MADADLGGETMIRSEVGGLCTVYILCDSCEPGICQNPHLSRCRFSLQRTSISYEHSPPRLGNRFSRAVHLMVQADLLNASACLYKTGTRLVPSCSEA